MDSPTEPIENHEADHAVDDFILADLRAGKRRLDIAMELARTGKLSQEDAMKRVIELDQLVSPPSIKKTSPMNIASWMILGCGILMMLWGAAWTIWLWRHDTIAYGPLALVVTGLFTAITGFFNPNLIGRFLR